MSGCGRAVLASTDTSELGSRLASVGYILTVDGEGTGGWKVCRRVYNNLVGARNTSAGYSAIQ